MKRTALALLMLLLFRGNLRGQDPDVKSIADTLVVEAEGKYEADPDLATLTFSVFAQDKNLQQTYHQASQSMRKIADVAENIRCKEGRRQSGLAYRAALLGRRQKEGGEVVRGEGRDCAEAETLF
jgi:hypothetical protein